MTIRWALAFTAALAGSSARAGDPAGVQTETLHVSGWTCVDCAKETKRALAKTEGIESVEADYSARTVSVRFDSARAGHAKIEEVIVKLGFQIAAEPGAATTAVPAKASLGGFGVFPAGADVQFSVLDGSKTEIAPLLAPGKYTAVDFYADWCVPCRALDKRFAEMMSRRKDLALRKLNIVEWESPLARQHLGSVDAIPYVRLYGPDGKKVGEFSGIDAAAEIEKRLPAVPAGTAR